MTHLMRRLYVVLISLTAAYAVAPGSARAQDRPYLDGAIAAANWLGTLEVETEGPNGAIAWVIVEHQPQVSRNLYAGTPGVILFLIELHRRTGDESYLERAKRGGDDLLGALPHQFAQGQGEAGLWTGMAGQGFVLLELARATGEPRFERGARQCIDLLVKGAEPTEAGVRWDPVYDVISGSAGVGLFLLHAECELGDARAGSLAKRVGDDLLSRAKAIDGAPDQVTFLWRDDADREMPNFSHGAAGIAYFLAALHQREAATSPEGETTYLPGAKAAARYLRSLGGERCLVHHHAPDGENLFYLGYCHGPPGAARLFMKLHEIEPDVGWDAWIERSALSAIDMGVPERSEGFWNNVGQCCGSAGLASYMLEVHRRTGDARYLETARALTDDLLARGARGKTADGRPTLKWIHAEHRIQPDFFHPQSGYMQGAAGIGLWLLELDAHDHGGQRGARLGLTLPDSPF